MDNVIEDSIQAPAMPREEGADNVTAVSQPFDGYWRIGGQSLNFWPAASAGFFVGSIAAVEIYNRPLVIAEIEQNFNINRGRFGV